MNIMCGMGEVSTKSPEHKQWDCGLGYYKPGVVFYKEDPNGYVVIDGKRCKLVEAPDRSNPNIAILNGQVFDNTFYKNPNDDIICSKLVDSISLPDGYNKCYYVYNTNLVSGTVPLISTNCILNKKYGHIYWSCQQKSPNTSPYGSTWRTGYIDENTNTTRCIMNSSNNKSILLYSDMRAGSGGQNITNDTGIFGYEITDKKQYKALINDNEYHDMTGTTQGQENNDTNLYFLSRCSDINLYYMFVVDDNKNITHCFIPSQNAATGQYGLYEVVSNQFFGSDSLNGVGEYTIPAPMTLRFRFSDPDYDPSAAGVGSSGVWFKQPHASGNIWDWTNTNTSWATAFGGGGTDIPGAFADYENNKTKVIAAGDTSTVTDFSRFFQNCYAITEICSIDTSNATTVFLMFSYCTNCSKFSDMDFSSAIANNGTAAVYQCCLKMKKGPNIKFPSNNNFTLANFFWGCENLEEVPLYDTHMCNNMSGMFSGKVVSGNIVGKMKLKKVPLFDTSNVTNFSTVFCACYLLESIPLFDTSKVNTMKSLFSFCNNLKEVPLFETKNVTDMRNMFECCYSLTSVPNFNTSKVSNMHNMFSGKAYNTTVFEDVDMHISEVPNFDYSRVTLFDDFFSNNIDITEIPDMNILANVTKCNNMFINCPNVQTGAKALYDKLSVKSSITNHTNAFKNCGSNTETGRAELAQIPTSWGGELA